MRNILNTGTLDKEILLEHLRFEKNESLSEIYYLQDKISDVNVKFRKNFSGKNKKPP